MKTRIAEPLSNPVPAAQYVRMSDEGQPYSIENQKAANAEYASRNGFVIVKTYADVGRSGVIAKNRIASSIVDGCYQRRSVISHSPVSRPVARWSPWHGTRSRADILFLHR
jgi:Resolvase, N terminal domain